jgi:hypothetical protein
MQKKADAAEYSGQKLRRSTQTPALNSVYNTILIFITNAFYNYLQYY